MLENSYVRCLKMFSLSVPNQIGLNIFITSFHLCSLEPGNLQQISRTFQDIPCRDSLLCSCSMAAFSCSGIPIPGMEATLFKSTSSETVTHKQNDERLRSDTVTQLCEVCPLLLTVLHAVLWHPRQQVQVVTVSHFVTGSIPRPEFTEQEKQDQVRSECSTDVLSICCISLSRHVNVYNVVWRVHGVPGVVVGARAEDVTQRVPGQTPDHPLMSHLHPPDLLLHPDTNNDSKHLHQSDRSSHYKPPGLDQ